MLKPTALSLIGVALFAAAAAAQDDAPGPDDAPDVHVEKKGVIVLKRDDGDGSEPEVIILEGDDLDGFDFDLGDMDLKGVKKRMARLRLSDGEHDFEWDSDFTGDIPPDLQKQLERMRKLVGGAKGLKLFEKGKAGELFEKLRTQVKGAQKARAKRERDAALAALKVDDETAAVVGPLLDKVLEVQRRIEREDTDGRQALRKGPQDEAALRSKLEGLRAAKKQGAAELEAAREELRQLVTLEQEIELVLRGILD